MPSTRPLRTVARILAVAALAAPTVLPGGPAAARADYGARAASTAPELLIGQSTRAMC
ncbi:hypothetical protein OHB11_38500 [Streptomyces zaomyceticus]|uniref:Uncharacterized protein n=1 Tax=Streptomyces zaomyceticus TaxID=68286 RepID=A0ABZ1LRV2_9ACTN|nr:hypothetical protein OG237_01340 [Streptomyces zaomyceticus]